MAVVLLSKIVKAVGVLCSAEISSLPPEERQAALEASRNYHGSPDWPVCHALSRFSPLDAAILVQRFSALDTMLERDQKETEVMVEAAWFHQRRRDRCTDEWASVAQPSFSASVGHF